MFSFTATEEDIAQGMAQIQFKGNYIILNRESHELCFQKLRFSGKQNEETN